MKAPIPSVIPISPSPNRTTPSRAITSSAGNTLAVYTRYLLRRTRNSTLIWTVSLAVYAAVIVLIYPSSKGTDVSNYSSGLRDAFNVTNFDTLQPFLATELFSYLPIVLAFVPILAFIGAIVGAEENGALDILLGTPLPRTHLIIANVVTVLINVTIMMAVMALALWLSGFAVDTDLTLGESLAASLTVVPIAMAHGGIALLCSAAMRQRSRALGASVGAIFLMYVINVVAKIVTGLDWLKYVSTFYWSGNAIEDGVFWPGVLVLLAVAAGTITLAVIRFERRDVFA